MARGGEDVKAAARKVEGGMMSGENIQ